MQADPDNSKVVPTTLSGKRIIIGVSGSIAAYKVAAWVREMVKESAGVSVVMTRSAERFVTALTFSALSGAQVYLDSDMFAHQHDAIMAHISLSREHDLILLAPTTAQTMARLAHGMADDMLSTMVLAAGDTPVIVCPAMNSAMFEHPATQSNINTLKKLSYTVVEPDTGKLACGEEGRGRLPDWLQVRETVLKSFCPQDLAGKKVLITAGPTREFFDPVRFISNRSSGKMGFALAVTAARRGADVTLISGPVSLPEPYGTGEIIRVTTGLEMEKEVVSRAEQMDIIVKTAAVADFRPSVCQSRKIKKASMSEEKQVMEKNPDILYNLGKKKKAGLFLVGFAAESHLHEEEGLRKLKEKNLDLMVVNDILGEDTGFEVDTNQVMLLTRTQKVTLPLQSKEDTANQIWTFIKQQVVSA